MHPLKDMFKKPGVSKPSVGEELLDKAREHFERAQKDAQACYRDEKFKRYRDKAAVAAWAQLEVIRNYRDPNPTQYAMVISNHVERLNAILALCGDVEADLRNGIAGQKKQVPNG